MASSDDNIITIQLEDSQSLQMHYELDATSSDDLPSIFQRYAQFKNLPLDSFQFTYKGKIIPAENNNDETTPSSLGIKDGDSILVSLVGRALLEENLANACTINSVTSVNEILSESPELARSPIRWSDSDGQELCTPPLFIAIDYGHVDLVRAMMQHHKDDLNTLKNENGDGGYNPLQWASFAGHIDVVGLLISEGKAIVDEEALSLAREHEHKAVADLLSEHIDLYTHLEGDEDAIIDKACREGDVAKVQEILENGYDLEKWKDGDGNFMALSPMSMALKFGHIEIVQLFMDKGGKVDLENGKQLEAVSE